MDTAYLSVNRDWEHLLQLPCKERRTSGESEGLLSIPDIPERCLLNIVNTLRGVFRKFEPQNQQSTNRHKLINSEESRKMMDSVIRIRHKSIHVLEEKNTI